MRILYVVDGRSPIALNWIDYFIQHGHEVHLVSTFPCSPKLEFTSVNVVPVAFSALKRLPADGERQTHRRGVWSAGLVSARTRFRQWLGPFTLPSAARKLASIIKEVQPDLIHAMRIPYEGMLASLALGRLPSKPAPLLLSVWGNDFTLHARSNPWMSALTRTVLRTTESLHTDCHRDHRLALGWGFSATKPSIVLPGAGGIQTSIFFPPGDEHSPPGPLVINPRGFRAYVRNDTFFQAIPKILAKIPEARFLCPTMAGDPQAERWLDRLSIRQAVDLLPYLSRTEMAECYRQSQVVISPSTHDGTPNTLLEAMACGCFPVAGDLESLREWIAPGENGFLIDPADPQSLADAIVRGLLDAGLRKSACQLNLRLISERAEYQSVMSSAAAFYRAVIGR